MNFRQALLDARVAEAAEAWLMDPQDTAVYSRLVAAVAERRRYLRNASNAGAGEEAGPRQGTLAAVAGDARVRVRDWLADGGDWLAGGGDGLAGGGDGLAGGGDGLADGGDRLADEDRPVASGPSTLRAGGPGTDGLTAAGYGPVPSGQSTLRDSGPGADGLTAAALDRDPLVVDGSRAGAATFERWSAEEGSAEEGSAEEGSAEEGSAEESRPEEPLFEERSWPAVRSVGADLVGDPAAVLRRLRGG